MSNEITRQASLVCSFLIFTCCLISIPAIASDDLLTVSWLRGEAEYRLENQEWQRLSSSSTLQLPVEIKTFANSGLTLKQGASNFSIRESSHIELTNSGMRSLKLVDRVLQLIGTVIYKIESNGDDFVVETPFLAATVKGTEFVVVATEDNSLISLQEGVLEILDLNTGDTELMVPGDIIGAEALAANDRSNASDVGTTAREQKGLNRVQVNNGNPIANLNRNSVGVRGQDRVLSNPIANAARQQRMTPKADRVNIGAMASGMAGFQGMTTAIEAKEQRANRGRGRGNGNGNGNGN